MKTSVNVGTCTIADTVEESSAARLLKHAQRKPHFTARIDVTRVRTSKYTGLPPSSVHENDARAPQQETVRTRKAII